MIQLKSFECFNCGMCFPMLEMEEDFQYGEEEESNKWCRLCWWENWIENCKECETERIIRGQKEIINIFQQRMKYLYRLDIDGK